MWDPNKHILDNEASIEFNRVIKKQSELEIVPSDSYRRNIAERRVQTFKCHYGSILAGVNDKCPMHLWCRLLPHAVLTLNLMRSSHVALKVSTYDYVHGERWCVLCNCMRHHIGASVERSIL